MMSARTHAHARDLSVVCEAEPAGVGELRLPGDVVSWTPTTYRERSASLIAGSDPAQAMAYARDLDPLPAGRLLLLVGDVYLLRGDHDQAVTAYQEARARARFYLGSRRIEAAALYGEALAAYGVGDLWRCLDLVDDALRIDNRSEARTLGERAVGAIVTECCSNVQAAPVKPDLTK